MGFIFSAPGRLLWAIQHCFISIALTLCSGQALSQESSSGSRSTTDKIIAAVPSNFPPQFSVDPQGNPAGFAIDVMNEVARLANIEIEYQVHSRWIEATNALRYGKANIIPNMGISEDRQTYADFTTPLETFVVSVFVREDTIAINSLPDLSERLVGVVENNVAVRLFAARGQPVVIYPDAPTLLFELLSGKIDAIAYPQPVLLRMAQEAGVDDRIRVLTPPITEIKRGIAVAKGQPQLFSRLQAAVTNFVGSPEYEAIYTRWYSRPQSFWTVEKVTWAAGFTVAIILLVNFIWRYNVLRRLNSSLERETVRRGEAENQLLQLNADLEDKVANRTAELQQRNAILDTIDQLSSRFIEESDPFVLYPELLDRLLTLTGSEYGFIGDVMVDESGDLYLKNYALSNLAWNEETNALYESYMKKGFEFHKLDNLFGLVITSRKAVIANDPAHDNRSGGFPAGHPHLDSFLGLPVFSGEHLVGEIGLANRQGGYDEALVQLLDQVTTTLGQIIVARWNREARQRAEMELSVLASTDHLTGIANRREFRERLSAEFNRADRYHESLSLVMLDIDHFKQVNDQFGHDAGDNILVELTELIKSQIREIDLFARWGGEEFLIMLPETDRETAKTMVERIRHQIEAHEFTEPSHVTVSFGLVTLRSSDDPDTFVSRADKALYKAKAAGRNCVVVGS